MASINGMRAETEIVLTNCRIKSDMKVVVSSFSDEAGLPIISAHSLSPLEVQSTAHSINSTSSAQ